MDKVRDLAFEFLNTWHNRQIIAGEIDNTPTGNAKLWREFDKYSKVMDRINEQRAKLSYEQDEYFMECVREYRAITGW